jgi:MFS family permease
MTLPTPSRALPLLASLLATRARRRMSAVAGTMILFGMVSAGTDVIFPLWTTNALGLSPGEWAQLRALRFVGVTVGVIFLGALSDRFGQRRFGVLAMLGAALTLVALGVGGRAALWIGMPIFGAFMSTLFVNVNTLTQEVSTTRQGVANTIYRALGAAAGIAAPIVVTLLALRVGGYAPVICGSALLMIASACVLAGYPIDEPIAPLADLRTELARLWAGYRVALEQRALMAFLHLSLLWGNLLVGVGAFAAIRFTRELGQSDQQFGLVSSMAGVAALVATLGVGLVLDRLSLRRLHGTVAVLASLCAVAIGLTDSLWLTAGLFVVFAALTSMLIGPTSMWVSRAAGAGTQIAAFSVHKVLGALYLALALALAGWLERLVGIRTIFWVGGVASLVVGGGFFLLQEPPRRVG